MRSGCQFRRRRSHRGGSLRRRQAVPSPRGRGSQPTDCPCLEVEDRTRARQLREGSPLGTRRNKTALGGQRDSGLTLVNLASILGAGGPVEEAVAAARLALDGDLSVSQRYVAQASLALWEASEEGDLLEIADGLRELAAQQERDGRSRYAGISRLNLAGILLWLGETSEAVQQATTAEAALGGPSQHRPWSESQPLRSRPLHWPSRGGCHRPWMPWPLQATAPSSLQGTNLHQSWLGSPLSSAMRR